MKRLYESMILVDPNKAREDEAAVEAELRQVIERLGGEIVNLEKWEERRLAYEIRHGGGKHRRAAYYLTHFHLDPDSVTRLERAFGLSEIVLRAMIIRDIDGPEVRRPKDYEEVGRFGDDDRPYGRRERENRDSRPPARTAARSEGGKPTGEAAPPSPSS